MAVSFTTPQLVSASSNTVTGNVTLTGGKRILVLGTARGAGSETFPPTLTVGGVTPTLVNVGGTDARIAVQTSTRQFFLAEIPAGSNPGSGTQSCTITFTTGDRVTMWVTEVDGDDGSFVDLDVGETNASSDTRNITSTATGQALFSAVIRASTATFSWTTSTSDEIAEGGASGAPMAIGALTLGAAGNYTSQWTATSGTAYVGQIAVVIAEASGGHDDLTGTDLLTGAPTLTAGTLTQEHALASASLTTTAPTLTAGTLSQAHALAGADLLTEAPTLTAGALSQHHALSGADLVTGAPTLSPGSLAGHIDLVGDSITTPAPTLTAGALTQLHALAGLGITTPVPMITAGTLNQHHALSSGNLVTGVPFLTAGSLGGEIDTTFTFVSSTDRDQPIALVSTTTRDQPIVLVSIGE